MATDVVIPALGESISEAVVSSWLKPDGAYVKRDEDIVELETDKVTMPLPAPAAGVIRHAVAQGDSVAVGAVIASIDESAAPPQAAAESKPEPRAAARSAGAPASAAAPPAAAVAAAVTEPKTPAPAPAPAPARDESRHSEDARVTPLARKIAQEHSVDLSRVPGTGPGGRIREQDVLAFIQTAGANGAAPAQADSPPRPAAPAQTAGPRAVTRERMSPLRQRIAVRLVEAQHTAAMLTTFNECDMSKVMDLRSRHKDQFEKQHGVRLGFMSFFIKAAVGALQRFPLVNASIVQGDKGPEIEHHHYCDVAVAVGTEKGLVVPVLRNCESLSFAEVEKGINDLAARARDAKLTLEDMQGGTFTISNGGVYGSMMSTPILNPPQSGILGTHNIIRRPVENPDKPGSGEIVVRPMMYLALSYDHRIVDGEGAVRFLRTIKEAIEDPTRLMLGV